MAVKDIFRENNAKAIWKDNENKDNRYLKFQTEFIAENPENITFYICTETDYELYINGSIAGFGQYEDFPGDKTYNAHDISQYVVKGDNLVSIIAYCEGENAQPHLSGLPMLIFVVTSNDGCLLASDENVFCAEAKEFVSGKIEPIAYDLPYNIGFNMAGDDGYREKNVSANWDRAVVCDDSEITYKPRPIKNLVLGDLACGKIISHGEYEITHGETTAEKMQYAALSYRLPNDIYEKDGNSINIKKSKSFLIVDLGEETVGYITFDVETKEDAEIYVAYGEHIADMRVRSFIDGRNYAFAIKLRKGRQKMRFCMHRIACRYLEIFTSDGVEIIHQLGLQKVNYPLDYSCDLRLNDRLFNKIYEVSRKTLDLCMHMHYEDCPQREQCLYAMDSRNEMLSSYYAFGETAMPKASLTLLAQGQKENGLLEMCAPISFERTIPYFSLAWVCALKEYGLFSGDLDFLKEMLPHAEKLMNFFKIDDTIDLIYRPIGYEFWNFYEWTDDLTNWEEDDLPRIDAPLNAFYMIALNNYIDICKWCGYDDGVLWAKERKEKIFSAFHKTFYCEDMGAYKSYIFSDDNHENKFSQLTQAWALCGGCVPEEFKPQIRESVVRDDFVEISLSHSIFEYDALMEDSQEYADFVLDDIERKWGYMLYNGATTFWETIKGEADFDRAGSLCHGWSATPVYIFWRYIMGIYPKTPGFKDYTVIPRCSKNICATGTLNTVNGILNADLSDGKTKINK